MIHKELPAANGFLHNPEKREVLLHLRDGNTHYNPHKWSFFGGAIEDGETPVEGFIRELAEEITIDADPGDAELLREYDATSSEGEPYRQYSFYIESDLPKSAMKLTEGADFDWIPLDKVFEYDLAPEVRTSLELFVKEKI